MEVVGFVGEFGALPRGFWFLGLRHHGACVGGRVVYTAREFGESLE